MKHLAAYLLLTLGGTASPSSEEITNVLASVGVEVDEDRVSKLLSELSGKDINEVRRLAKLCAPTTRAYWCN
jgi:large subunit ribosomal protein LP2